MTSSFPSSSPPVSHVSYTPIDERTSKKSNNNNTNNTARATMTIPTSPSAEDDDQMTPLHQHSDHKTSSSARKRINSADIPRTYSGLYGSGGTNGDLLPFELSRNLNTDWFDNANGPGLLFLYLSVIAAFQLAIMAVTPISLSFTITNIVHGIITMTYLHWIKGSPNFYEQGEMNAMTFWEQLTSKPDDDKMCPRRENRRRVLLLVPTLLCYVGCHFGLYEYKVSLVNLVVWSFCIVAKMPFMNGVRLLGLNRTVGIDDNVMGEGDEDDSNGGSDDDIQHHQNDQNNIVGNEDVGLDLGDSKKDR